jgi:hypothetical protein
MGREEEREILAGSKPDPAPEIDLETAVGSTDANDVPEVPDPDRRGLGDDHLASAFETGDPDAVPTDVTESPQYQEALAEAKRQVKAGEAIVEDGQAQMPPTRYDRS